MRSHQLRTSHIHAAILADHGNTDESYPIPLTCYVCGARPLHTRYPEPPPPRNNMWFAIESDPLPAGWQETTDPTYQHRMVYCASCYAARGTNDEEGAPW